MGEIGYEQLPALQNDFLPATPVCFTSSDFETGQKHVPYTIGPVREDTYSQVG